jgi:GTP cyclohydrolase II
MTGGFQEPVSSPARLRAVQRASADLRRGVPVVLSGVSPLAILAAETADQAGLQELLGLGSGAVSLLLSPVRAATLLRRPVASEAAVIAVRFPVESCRPEVLAGVADPSAAQFGAGEEELVAVPDFGPAALSLLKLARLLPAAVAVPLASEPGPERGLIVVSAVDVLGYRRAAAASLRRVAEAMVPLEGAEDCRIVAFRTADGAVEHLAIVVGDPASREAPLVRLHSECFTGDLLGSLRCDCGMQLRGAILRMTQEGAGVVLYLAQEGRGIGLPNKLRAYALQDRGLDTLDANRALGWGADERSFLSSAAMLRELGLSRVRLLTNNPEKVAALAGCGIEVVTREPHSFPPNGVNDSYLATKARRFGHLLG